MKIIDKFTGAKYEKGDEIRLSDERIAEIRTVNTNMVEVIREAPKTKNKKSQ